MEVETEDRVKVGVEVDVEARAPFELRFFERRNGLGKRNGMTMGIFVRVHPDSRAVVVPSHVRCQSVLAQSESTRVPNREWALQEIMMLRLFQ